MKDVIYKLVQMEFCGVIKWGKRNTLRWFGYHEGKKSEESVNKVYVSEIEGPRRGKSV